MTGRGPFIPALVALVALSGGLAAAMHGALTASAPVRSSVRAPGSPQLWRARCSIRGAVPRRRPPRRRRGCRG